MASWEIAVAQSIAVFAAAAHATTIGHFVVEVVEGLE
jgi:hypothetical protein